MVRPIDYTIDVQNPLISALQGYRTGQQIRENRLRQQALEDKKARAEELQADLAAFAGKPVVTAEDTKQLYLKYPKLAVKINAGLNAYDDRQKQEYAEQLYPFYTMVKTGDIEGAKAHIDELATAYENSNDPIQAKRIKQLGKSLDRGPENALMTSRLVLGPLMGDKFYDLEKDIAGPVQMQKTGMITVRDENTNQIKMVVGSFDPRTGALNVSEGTLPDKYTIVSKIGETPKEKQLRTVTTAGKTQAVKEAISAGAKYSEKSDIARDQIVKLDNAINIIEEGLSKNASLGIGWIRSRLPKFDPFAIKMQQAARELGLGVVQQVTFGALSEKELQLAMDTGFPKTLKPQDALQWLKDKKKAQQKLKSEMDKAAAFVGSQNADGSFNTIADWKKLQIQQRKQQAQAPSEPEVKPLTIETGETTATNPKTGQKAVYRNNKWYDIATGKEL